MAWRRSKFVAALGGGLMLACCTTMYVAPVGEALAEATVINMASEPVSIFIYGDAKECTDRKVISPIVAPGERRTLGLAAKRYVAMTVIHRRHFRRRRRCDSSA